MLVLMVNIKVKPGRRDDFIAAIREDGEGTTTKEEGNLQFSAIQDSDDPDRFFLFEVYRDEAALDAHRQMPHFLKYREATAGLYAEETVRRVGTNVFPDDSGWAS
ncbi:MAG: antibiotic biosynthesis monooxygenase [Chloroflexi bacterium]|nr:antibiotic biosynthesis monooxygenase [Chloroflexota bacterium]MCI0778644.1 antibiotic biosynthesis monooxygenase [Chloroflexota bacterium]MCI0816040.1 antibiotic biosynthesis monooxygenase [Chloroflexota bacterium]